MRPGVGRCSKSGAKVGLEYSKTEQFDMALKEQQMGVRALPLCS
jgi:hypothetical protein